MSTTPQSVSGQGATVAREWLPIAVGLLVLYVPTFHDLAGWLWQQDEHAHGPIILAVVIWLFWRGRSVLFAPPGSVRPASGLLLAAFGLLAYMLGRSQGVALLEVGALAPLLAGILLAMRGWEGVRSLWFPILFVVFMIPLPGILVDELTGPLKRAVSVLAVDILHPIGYPIARDGVIITIGQYQLLVADACSGMNSMFSLTALGLLFMHLRGRQRLLHNCVVLASILPIAFAANIVRVLILILVTYHFGDEAGQGFLHGSAGMILVIAALCMLLALDSTLTRLWRPARPA